MKLYLVFLIISISVWVSENSIPRTCGNRPLAQNEGESRVVGGRDALPGNWPWMVSIQIPYGDDYGHACGATLLNNLWLLTASHCFKNQGSAYFSWRLVIGATQLSHLGPETQIRFIKEKIEHPKYNPETEANDIALLMMNKAILFSNYIQPACLPSKSVDLSRLTECYIAGWGVIKEESSEAADILQEAKVDYIPTKLCNSLNWYNGAIKAFNLCAGYEHGGIDSCQGDSGGPLMCKRKRAPVFSVVGVTSWGSGCAQRQSPGVYSSTQYYIDWIFETIYKESASKTV